MSTTTAVRTFACAAIAALSPVLAAAQNSGTLRGLVHDAEGRVLPGAVIRVAGTRLGAYVDSTGRYRVSDIPAGRYVVYIS
jgi:hypothetical protein